MKISKTLICVAIILSVLLSLALSHKSRSKHRNKNRNRNKHKVRKSKSHSRNRKYDAVLSPTVVVDYLKQNVDQAKDEKQVLTTCLKLIGEDRRLEETRQKLWTYLEKLALDNTGSYSFNANQLKEFIGSIDIQASIEGNTSAKISCSSYIASCLKPDDVLNSQEQKTKIKSLLQSEMGVYTERKENKNSNLITSFASYNRDSPLRSNDLFKKLNQRGEK